MIGGGLWEAIVGVLGTNGLFDGNCACVMGCNARGVSVRGRAFVGDTRDGICLVSYSTEIASWYN